MEYEEGLRLDTILENQEKQFKIEQYKVNLIEAIAKKLEIKTEEIQNAIRSNDEEKR